MPIQSFFWIRNGNLSRLNVIEFKFWKRMPNVGFELRTSRTKDGRSRPLDCHASPQLPHFFNQSCDLHCVCRYWMRTEIALVFNSESIFWNWLYLNGLPGGKPTYLEVSRHVHSKNWNVYLLTWNGREFEMDLFFLFMNERDLPPFLLPKTKACLFACTRRSRGQQKGKALVVGSKKRRRSSSVKCEKRNPTQIPCHSRLICNFVSHLWTFRHLREL